MAGPIILEGMSLEDGHVGGHDFDTWVVEGRPIKSRVYCAECGLLSTIFQEQGK